MIVATFQVCSTIVHPSYDKSSAQNDLSVLRLCNPVTFSRSIAPACLPSSNNNYDSVQVRVVTTILARRSLLLIHYHL